MSRTAGATFLIAVAALFSGVAGAGAQTNLEEVWDDSDTAIANHYIQALQQSPDFGKVLDLLWAHYEKHDQTRLLLQYFDQASQPPDALTAKLINGHLLRKKGNIEAALETYEAVYAKAAENIFVVRALAQTHLAADHQAQAAEFFEQLAELEGPQAESWVETQLTRADLLRGLDRIDEAVAVWRELLDVRSGDLDLSKRIVAQLLEEGRTAEAIEIYALLAEDSDPERRLLAMKELGRLYEFIDDLENAVETYRKALGTIHFKHFLHDEFLGRLVRVHERFSRVDELKEEWEKAASEENPTEAALLRMVKFYDFTAESVEQEIWLSRLTELVPANTGYRQQLAELLLENDKFDEAGVLVEELVEKLKPTPVTIAILQARVALSLQGVETAEQLLAEYLENYPPSREGLKRLLRFSQTHYIDGLTEKLLLDQQASGWAEEGQIPEMTLAAFHHERGRLAKVEETLTAYVDEAANDQQRGERLLRVAEVYRDLRMLREAQAAVHQAQDLGQARRGHLMILAETFVEQRDIKNAIETFQSVWEMSERTEQRIEVDQRIFSVLRATSNAETLTDEAPLETAGERWTGLWQFYNYLKQTAADDHAPMSRFRVAWWAIRVEDYSEAYKQLPLLHNPDAPVMAYEEMLLDLAERTENRALVMRQLELISLVNPERDEEYRIRKALMRLELGYEDEAVRALQNLVARPEASLKAVQALAKAYKQQDRTRALEELWAAAFKNADLLERRQILKPYTNALIELGRIEDALGVMSEMIEAETDLGQRRKLLQDQLSFASERYLLEEWMLPRYARLTGQQPLDRFFPEALARVQLALGNADAAFAAMKRAFYMSNNDSELLEELGELASRSSDLKAAIYYQRQLIAAEDDETSPDDWLSLIDRLEDDLRVAEADLTRKRLESKFGQDPEFLRQLGIHYLNAGDREAARRILEKIAALRPWDVETLLELGLLVQELGDEDRAAEIFARILEETAESAPAPDSALEKIPFVSAERTRPVPGQSIGLGLETIAEYVEEYRDLPDDMLDEIGEWLRDPKPEFLRKPGAVEEIRLRAIEELARFGGSDPEWIRRWRDPDLASPTERIWALAHANAHAATQQLLDDYIRPRTAKSEEIGRWDFLYVLQTLRSGEIESLKSWIDGVEAREKCIALGIRILLRDRDYVFDDVRLREAVRLIEMTVDQIREQIHSLRFDQRLPEAVRLGELSIEAQELEDFSLFIDLAGLCHELGRRESRQRLLSRAFAMFSNEETPPLYSFYDTIRGFYALQETAEDQEQVIAAASAAIARIPSRYAIRRDEAAIWLAMATEQYELVLERVRRFVSTYEETRKSYRSFQAMTNEFVSPLADREMEIEYWRTLQSLLVRSADRIPREHWAELTVAIDDFELNSPSEEATAAQFSAFKTQRILWSLETANVPERSRMIEEYLGEAISTEEFLEFANSLVSRGMQADALPIFRFLIDVRSDDFNLVRSYLNACRSARSYDEGLNLLESCLTGRLQRPESMTDAYIHRNYSNLLFISEKVEQLAAISQTQSSAAFAEVIRDKQIRAFYQRHLISLYRKRKQFGEAVRVFEAMVQNKSLTREDRLDWADTLETKGDFAGAIELLDVFGLTSKSIETTEGLPILGPTGSPIEAEVVRRLGRLHAAIDEPDTAKLIELAKLSLNYPESPTLTREIAGYLVEAGLPAVADAILTLRARTARIDGLRFDLLLHQLKVRLGDEDDGPANQTIQQLLGSWRGNVADAELFLELVESNAESRAQLWQTALGDAVDCEISKVLARAGQVVAGGPIEPLVNSIDQTASRDEMRLAVRALMRIGDHSAAAEILSEFHDRAEFNPLSDAELAIEVFSELGDEAALAEWRVRAEGASETPTRMALVANAFSQNGHPEIAASVFRAHYRKLRVLTIDQQFFIEQYSVFLIAQKQFAKAERVLMELFRKPIGGDLDLLIDLYGQWGKIVRFDSEVRKFYLDQPSAQETVESAANFPNHRPVESVDAKGSGENDSSSKFFGPMPYRF
ncbi:MAG: Flp pilus assembly protein TadD/predicted Zn-dependent protease [Verrucomicrobiales bacterium]|jgi:Flp pilus assembly protein TadD/predicted Zn-dependent protease